MNRRALMFRLNQKLKSYSPREIIMTLATCLMLVAGACQMTFNLMGWLDLKPIQSQINREIAQQTTLAELLAKLRDPQVLAQIEQQRQSLATLESQSQQLQVQIEEQTNVLVSPDRMTTLLAKLLNQQQRVKLKSLSKLPVEQLAVENQAAVIFIHKVEVILEADYQSLGAWLASLEQQDEKIYWQRLTIEQQAYPINQVRLVVYTLSNQAGWLGV